MKATPRDIANMLRDIADRVEQIPIDEIDVRQFEKRLGTKGDGAGQPEYDGTFSIEVEAGANLSFTKCFELGLKVRSTINLKGE